MAGLRASLLLLTFLLCAALDPRAVRAQASAEVEQAYQAYLEADFDGARRHLAASLERADAERSDLARAHALSAVLASLEPARSDEVDPAIDAALALDPEVALPEGAPRQITERFAAARALRRERPAGVDLSSFGAGASRGIEARSRDVPPSLAGSVHLTCGEAEARDPALAQLTVGADATSCSGRVLDPLGRALFSSTLALDAEARGGDEGWIVLGVVLGAAVVGVAIGVGVAVGTSQDAGLGAPVVLEW